MKVKCYAIRAEGEIVEVVVATAKRVMKRVQEMHRAGVKADFFMVKNAAQRAELLAAN